MANEDMEISKSQRKREMLALRDLGARITELPPKRRDALPLSPKLQAALVEFDRLRAREARRRHLSFIGKLMRTEDIEGIRAQVDALDAVSATHVRAQHEAERWRARLLDEPAALDEFMALRPQTDRPRLRGLIADCQSGMDSIRGRRSYRELFRALRDALAD